MKHSIELIGSPVHVFRREWQRPEIPRAGIITGFGADKGLFTVTVFHAPMDMRKSLPPLGFLDQCLLVDDDDDTPIGVSEYARLRAPVVPSHPQRLASDLVIHAGGKNADPRLSMPPGGAMTNPNPRPETSPSPAEDADDEIEIPAATPPPSTAPKTEPVGKPTPEPSPPPTRPAGQTPFEILRRTPPWLPIAGIEGLTITDISATECILTLDGDERPIARLVYIPFKGDPRTINNEPVGFTFKVRDQAGRCSKPVGENLLIEGDLTPALARLAQAILAAKQAPLGDWGSTAANMQSALNASKTAAVA